MSVVTKLKTALAEKRHRRLELKVEIDAHIKSIRDIVVESVYLDPVDIDIEQAHKLTGDALKIYQEMKVIDRDIARIQGELNG